MAAVHETAYPRFKAFFTSKELSEVFTLSSDELVFLNRKTKTQNNVSRLGFAILLKCYQYLGRPIRVSEVNHPNKLDLFDQGDFTKIQKMNSLYKNTETIVK